MRIFVGNLLLNTSEDDVQKLFEAFGEVAAVSIRHKSGKNPRSFGFVEMPNEAQAQSAIAALEGKDFRGRILDVTPERVHVERPTPSIVVPLEEIEELPEIKEKKVVHSTRRKPSGSWEKRKGKGKAKAWKKRPGGVKKKFKA